MLPHPPPFLFRIDSRIKGVAHVDLTDDWHRAEAILDCLENVDAEKRLTIYRRIDSPTDAAEQAGEEWPDIPAERVNDLWHASVAGALGLIAFCCLRLFL